jgi:membrane protein implicated in regulation of membrane protease activity
MLLMMLLMAFPLIGVFLFFVLPWKAALPAYLVGVAISVFYHRIMVKSRMIRVKTGRRGMIGRTATVVDWHQGEGTVRCHGEFWKARMESGRSASPGSEVFVVDLVEHLVLILRPLESAPPTRHRIRFGPSL